MDLQVNINPEDINNQIVEAVAKSAIGEKLNEIVEKSVKEISTSYKNPIEPVVQQFIRDEVRKLVENNYTDMIKAKVAEKLTDEMVADLFDKMWERLSSRY